MRPVEELREELVERTRLAVVGGYDERQTILDGLVELIEYDPEAQALVDSLTVPVREYVAERLGVRRPAPDHPSGT